MNVISDRWIDIVPDPCAVRDGIGTFSRAAFQGARQCITDAGALANLDLLFVG